MTIKVTQLPAQKNLLLFLLYVKWKSCSLLTNTLVHTSWVNPELHIQQFQPHGCVFCRTSCFYKMSCGSVSTLVIMLWSKDICGPWIIKVTYLNSLLTAIQIRFTAELLPVFQHLNTQLTVFVLKSAWPVSWGRGVRRERSSFFHPQPKG